VTSAEIIIKIEAEMLEKLAQLLMNDRDYGAEWQFRKLRQMGLFQELAANAWRQNREALLKAVRSEIRKHALDRAAVIDRITRAARKPISAVLAPDADPAIIAIIQRWERSALVQINEAAATMLSGAPEKYQAALRKAAVKVELGISGRQAIAEVVDEWAQGGLDSVVTKSGKVWSLESYVQVAIRTSSTNAATAVQWERMDELGEDLIEISSHLGAREKCAPYQGRVFSRSGASKKYPPLSATSYGDPGGLFGINCRHVAYPFFPDVGKTFKPISEQKNAKAYAEEQEQRHLEREVRRAKLGLQLAEKTNDPSVLEKAKARVKARQASVREFAAKTDRPRQYARERVGVR